MDKYNVRDVNDREIYESYMGILRISPNENGSDDITQNIIGKESTRLSDSDGDMLAMTFIPKARYCENILSSPNDGEWLINIQTNIAETVFAVKTVNIRAALSITPSAGITGISDSPIHSYSIYKNQISGLFYPVESPYDSTYYNDLQLDKRPIDSLSEKERDEELAKLAPSEYEDSINNEHYVKVNGKIVYYNNKNNESVPALYTKDKILAHGHGASYTVKSDTAGDAYDSSCDSREINLSENLRLKPDSLATHLCWADIDKLVWDSLSNALQGDMRHTKGRYTTLGAEVNTDIRGNLGIEKDDQKYSLAANNNTAYSLKQTAPLVGLDVPVGTIIYNAMPPARYFFYMAKQILCNNYDTPNATIKTENLKGHIEPFAKRDDHFAANLVKNFVLCDGKKVNNENYPALNPENDYLNPDGTLKDGVTTGSIYDALFKDGGIKTLPLLRFNTLSSILLRGATWKAARDIEGNTYDILTSTNDFGLNQLDGDSSYKYKIGENYSFDKKIEALKIYPFNIAYKHSAAKHYHYIFSSSSGLNGENRNTGENVVGTGTSVAALSAAKSFKPELIGSDTEELPIINAANASFPAQKNGRPSGGWNYFTARPLNFISDTLSDFKKRIGATANNAWWSGNLVASVGYTYDKKRYIDYSTGKTNLYWGNKPIKNHSFTCLCNDTLDYPVENNTKNLPLVGGNRKVKKDAFLILVNEAESLMPASIEGGWPRMLLTNEWSVREGRNSSFSKHRTKCYSNDILTGGYKIGSFDATKAKSAENIKDICLTSLETENVDKIGKLKTGISTAADKPEISINDLATSGENYKITDNNGFDVYTSEPTPPGLNFIPLMRI